MLSFFRRFASRIALSTFALAACASPSTTRSAAHAPPLAAAVGPSGDIKDLASLHENDRAFGFVARALYVDDDGKARGARFVHEKSGFVFDYLMIESAPQAMIYAWTYPPTEGGEPHTQEHLLLGKGNAGRWLGNVEHASFAETGAFTAARRTAYHFDTAAGPATFFGLLETTLRALLHPDYSDEEIRREVRNFSVTKQSDGSLALDERGTVYNEMVRVTESSGDRSWYAKQRLLYGEDHPLSHEQGGTPEGIRSLTPERIHAFHAAHYQLGNMGGLVALPSSLTLRTVLESAGRTLDTLARPEAKTQPLLTEATLPPIHPAPIGATRIVEFPYASADHPTRALFAWPATRKLGSVERTALDLFLETFAGGRSSNLYKVLIDRTTRVLDVGATNVWGWVPAGFGEPPHIGVEDVATAHADQTSMDAIRAVIRTELERIAAMPDGSSELAAFNARMQAHVTSRRRWIDKSLDTPPQFGARSTGDDWIETLDDLARDGGFVRSLTYKAAIANAMTLASATTNPWRDRIRSWGLLETPYAVVGRPSQGLRAELDRERKARVDAELTRLEAVYGTRDPQEALKKREAEIAAADDAIANAEKAVPAAPLAPDPPMTEDDTLVFTSENRDGIPRATSTFEAMKSATVGLALNLDETPTASLPWLPVLPALMTDVGVIRDGKPIPYDEVEDRLRREVLAVGVELEADTFTGRAEIALDASGNDAEETKRALAWMRDFMTTPDWRPENLPRVRDVVEQKLTRLHDTMSDVEEHWVQRAAESYRRQDRPVLSHASSFLTGTHDAFVVSWRLEGGDDAKGILPFLAQLESAGKKLDRASLTKLAAALASENGPSAIDPKLDAWVRAGRALPKPAQTRVRKAGRDLTRFLADIPDASLAADWASLCREMAQGAKVSPRDALLSLTTTLAALRHSGNARVWSVGARAHHAAVAGDLEAILRSLDPAPLPHVQRSPRPSVLDRAKARGANAAPTFVALMNPNTANGALVHSAPTIGLDETREDALVSFLAANVFGGVGTQSFYKRIWGTALAYSGNFHAAASNERMRLYSDRCADLAQLLRFTDSEVRHLPSDPRFVDYAVVPSFSSRTGEQFEVRAEAMAIDLMEKRTPERVRAFRARLLALRSKPGLAEAMHAAVVPAMSAVIPSLAGSTPLPAGAIYFTTGPETAIAAYEKEIARSRGEGTHVLRLWARDFWDVAEPRPAK